MQQLEEKVVHSVTRQGWLDGLGRSVQQVVNGFFRGSETGRRTKDFLNGVWLAHPLHPAVTDVPVGAWTTAVIMDGVETITGRDMSRATSTAIGIGIGGAVASALSGVADWSDYSGEPRRVGMAHALLNTLALGLFGASFWRRQGGNRSGAKLLSAAGYLSMFTAAYLGGELVYRLATQIDRNAWVRGPQEFTPVMREADLPPDRPTRVDAGGTPVVLVRHGDRLHALSDVCSHMGCSLSEGRLDDGSIVCPCHGSTYRLEDGGVIHGPSPYPQPHYEVRVRGDQIEVRTALR